MSCRSSHSGSSSVKKRKEKIYKKIHHVSSGVRHGRSSSSGWCLTTTTACNCGNAWKSCVHRAQYILLHITVVYCWKTSCLLQEYVTAGQDAQTPHCTLQQFMEKWCAYASPAACYNCRQSLKKCLFAGVCHSGSRCTDTSLHVAAIHGEVVCINISCCMLRLSSITEKKSSCRSSSQRVQMRKMWWPWHFWHAVAMRGDIMSGLHAVSSLLRHGQTQHQTRLWAHRYRWSQWVGVGEWTVNRCRWLQNCLLLCLAW